MARSYIVTQDGASRSYAVTDGLGSVNASTVGSAISGAAEKTTPIDTDTIPLIDSGDSNALKKFSWVNLLAAAKAHFDTLYDAVTTENVRTAGALMDDEVANLAQVKAFDSAAYAAAAEGTLAGTAVQPATLATAISDHTGAADPHGDRAYADSLVIGLVDDRGGFDASVNTFPTTGGSGAAGAILKGDLWTISVVATSGPLDGYLIGCTLRALVDTPGQTATNWSIIAVGFGYAPENAANKSVNVATDQASNTKFPSVKAVYDWAVGLFSQIGHTHVSADVTDATNDAVNNPGKILKTNESGKIFLGAIRTQAESATITTGGALAFIQTDGEFASIFTTGSDAKIYTDGDDAHIITFGANAYIRTLGPNGYIQSGSTFKISSGGNTTTLAHSVSGSHTLTLTPTASATLTIGASTTLSGGTHSGTNTGDQDLSSYATKTGTETLTNKTLTAPKSGDNIITDSTTARTYGAVDSGSYIRCTNAGAITHTIPTNAVTPFGIGEEIYIRRAAGAGVITVGGAGVTINNNQSATIAASGNFAIKKVATDTWDFI